MKCPAPEMTRTGWPRPRPWISFCVAVPLGEDDGQGLGLDVFTGPAVTFCPAGLFEPVDAVELGLDEPGLAESGLLLDAPGLVEVAALACALPPVPVMPELGSVVEEPLVVGDGDVEVDGDGLVLVGVGVELRVAGGELEEPGIGETLDVGETARWHLAAAVEVGETPLLKPGDLELERSGDEPCTALRPGPPPWPPFGVVRPVSEVGEALMRGMAMAAKAPAATTKMARPVAVSGRSQRRPGLA